MKVGLVSESLVLSGAYLISQSNHVLGGICLGSGVLGGLVSYLYNVTLEQGAEKRRSEIYEIFKGVVAKLLQAVNDVNIIKQHVDKTVH